MNAVSEGRLASMRAHVSRYGQEHVLAFADRLQPRSLGRLLDQIEAIDFDRLQTLIRELVLARPAPVDLSSMEPAPYFADGGFDAATARAAGESVIRAGQLAAFTVAGGQGTRLGWNGPKGCFPATVLTGKPLFRCFAEQILASQRRFGVTIPWYIMTSPLNDADTRRFFEDNNFFGLQRENVFAFEQGVMPSVDLSGKLILEEIDSIAFNPDGHGGAFAALARSGALEDMSGRGVKHISYFQVDNPLARVVDPVFVGLHVSAESSGEMSSKMVAKRDPEEKVGVFCRVGGKTTVVEYSDLPASKAIERDASGALRYNAGSIAIHLISVEFARRLTQPGGRLQLPFHRADKKVACVHIPSGERVEPATANAVKLEAFVFDALPLAERSVVMETLRHEEFAPIKNASGVDSPATSHELQCERAARWLEACGVQIARDAAGRVASRIEISPLTAMDAEELRRHTVPLRIDAGHDVVL